MLLMYGVVVGRTVDTVVGGSSGYCVGSDGGVGSKGRADIEPGMLI